MYDKFERLNRETRDYKNNNCPHPTASTSSGNNSRMGMTASQYFNYLNNQTYKQNNGQYSKHYF